MISWLNKNLIFLSIFLDDLLSICRTYYERVKTLESEKYDMEKEVEYKDYKVWKSVFPPPNTSSKPVIISDW